MHPGRKNKIRRFAMQLQLAIHSIKVHIQVVKSKCESNYTCFVLVKSHCIGNVNVEGGSN